MAIEYIKDGATSVKAAEKIKIVLHDKRLTVNPFIRSYVQPIMSEALNNGGGLYRFETVLGIDAATRRTAPVTSTAVTFGNELEMETINLTVDKPLEINGGKPRPLSLSDVKQLDGIDFSAISNKQVTNSLIQGEVQTVQDIITTIGDQRVVTYAAGDGPLDKVKLIKTEAAKYLDINVDTMPDTIKYFDSGVYNYDKGQIDIYINPIDEMDFSNAITDAGTGSDFQYQQFTDGKVPFIGGFRLTVTRWVPRGTFVIMPQVIGVPDADIMLTQIVLSQVYDGTKIIYGKHYFDAILVAPELITIIQLEEPVPPVADGKKTSNKVVVSKRVSNKATKEAIKEVVVEELNEESEEVTE